MCVWGWGGWHDSVCILGDSLFSSLSPAAAKLPGPRRQGPFPPLLVHRSVRGALGIGKQRGEAEVSAKEGSSRPPLHLDCPTSKTGVRRSLGCVPLGRILVPGPQSLLNRRGKKVTLHSTQASAGPSGPSTTVPGPQHLSPHTHLWLRPGKHKATENRILLPFGKASGWAQGPGSWQGLP